MRPILADTCITELEIRPKVTPVDPNYMARWIDYKIPNTMLDPSTGVTQTSRLAERAALVPNTGMEVPGEEDVHSSISIPADNEVTAETVPKTLDTSLEVYQQIRQLPHETTVLNVDHEVEEVPVDDSIIAQPGRLTQEVNTPVLNGNTSI